MISIDSDVAVEYQEQGSLTPCVKDNSKLPPYKINVPKKFTEEEISTRKFPQINIYI